MVALRMIILQFLIGMSCTLITAYLAYKDGKRDITRNIAALIIRLRIESQKKQDIGGNADEHLRLEGEIRAYDHLLGFNESPPS
jgi:hypothetical protein